MPKIRFSIVIPVHNKAALTRQCLDSILEARPEVPFEVIVVDDASSDSTPTMLAGYGNQVRTVRLDRNSGFATACNAGAEAAKGTWVVFLNNDTLALPGWLDALARYAEEHPRASVIGSKLLFPDGTIQHAGVVFSLSGDPLHIYAGCAADHPAVNKSRRFQSVTAACLMVKKRVFFEFDGLDTDYHNDLEDVDLCLRLGQHGHEVHYCHESVLYHLESASRGYADKPSASAKVYRERWGTRVKADEMDYYLEDGLLEPLRFSADALPSRGARREDAMMLQARSNQFAQLLREAIRLSTYTHEASGAPIADPVPALAATRTPKPSRTRIRKRIEGRLSSLRDELGNALHDGNGRPEAPVEEPAGPAPAEPPPYREVLSELPDVVRAAVPEGRTVLVVSKGDDELLRMPGRQGWHFPRADDGRYAGYYPKTSDDAIAHLEALRDNGAQFLVIPATYLWWLEHYAGLASHLEERYETLSRARSGVVIDLRGAEVTADNIGRSTAAVVSADSGAEAVDGKMSGDQYARLIDRVGQVVDTVLPPHATVLVVSRGDDQLVELDGRNGWHFPRQEDGRYLGYHPADDQAAIAHLEQLRAQGAEYLVFPSASFWWLDHYRGFADHLRERYATVAHEPGACLVFELSERFLSDVVRALVPEGSRIAVLSRYSGDVAGLPTDTTVALRAPDDEQEAIERIAALPSDGVDFLVVPRSAFEWLEQHPALTRYLRSRHCFVTRQELACELYELTAEPSGAARGALGAEASSADREPRSQTGTGSGVGGWLRRLLGRR